jgi:hypothetical protein
MTGCCVSWKCLVAGLPVEGIATADMAVRLALAKRPKQFPELGTPRTHREFSARENPRVLAPSKCSHDFAIWSCNLKWEQAGKTLHASLHWL